LLPARYSVISLAMVGQWFVRGIDTAMAIYSIFMSIGFMIAFPVVGSLVQSSGWRSAWLAIGLALLVALAPASLLLARQAPAETPSLIDASGDEPLGSSVPHGATWREAVATPAFWTFSIGAALYGLVASGIGLFNESILAERGFGPSAVSRNRVHLTIKWGWIDSPHLYAK
jgi:MFS family permease